MLTPSSRERSRPWVFSRRFLLILQIEKCHEKFRQEKGKISNQDYSIFSEYIYGHNLPPEWFDSIDKMAIFINAFQLFLLASGSVP